MIILLSVLSLLSPSPFSAKDGESAFRCVVFIKALMSMHNPVEVDRVISLRKLKRLRPFGLDKILFLSDGLKVIRAISKSDN